MQATVYKHFTIRVCGISYYVQTGYIGGYMQEVRHDSMAAAKRWINSKIKANLATYMSSTEVQRCA